MDLKLATAKGPLPVIVRGDQRLRSQARPVSPAHIPSLQPLIEDLIATAKARDGVGIAAPQVANGLQLFVVMSKPNRRYPHAPVMPPTAMINPTILAHSEAQSQGWEGCLSVPGLRGLVPRYRRIEVAYLDRWGQPQRHSLEGFLARIFQHEYDHLQGVLFPDRVQASTDLVTEERYWQMVGR